jgi:hypothetical protein
LNILKIPTIVEKTDKNMLLSRMLMPIAEKGRQFNGKEKGKNNRLVALLQPEDAITQC